MKKVCIFIGGVVTGAILVVVVSMLIAGGNSTYKGITLFEKEGECISENSFKVFQVLDSGEALANEVKQGYLIPTGLTVLFLNEDGLSYYDDQVIKIFTCKKLLMTKKKLPVRFTGQHFTIDKVLIKDAIRQANISRDSREIGLKL